MLTHPWLVNLRKCVLAVQTLAAARCAQVVVGAHRTLVTYTVHRPFTSVASDAQVKNAVTSAVRTTSGRLGRSAGGRDVLDEHLEDAVLDVAKSFRQFVVARKYDLVIFWICEQKYNFSELFIF